MSALLRGGTLLTTLRRLWKRCTLLLRRRPTLPPALWQATVAHYPFLHQLPAHDLHRLRELSATFLAHKQFTGAGGLTITDPMALAVAAQACLPLLHLSPAHTPAHIALGWYDDFVGIVLHPGAVVAAREVTDHDGIVHRYRAVLNGEAMHGGPVMLNWPDVAHADQTAAHGYNLVIHEFAHKIELRDGRDDGCPPLPAGFGGSHSSAQARQQWQTQISAEYEHFSHQVAAAERFAGLAPKPHLDPYGAESLSEFFAVATEAYFVNPALLRAQSTGLYALLDSFYQVHRSA